MPFRPSGFSLFQNERSFLPSGNFVSIGVDEVGRGAFAGPVVAAACSLKIKNSELSTMHPLFHCGIWDSKKLSANEREKIAPLITQFFHNGVGVVSVEDINRLGIVASTFKAMRRAIFQLLGKTQIEQDFYLLVDGFPIPNCRGFGKYKQKAIIKGDEKILTIGAAAILAKVYRDTLMQRLSVKYRKYQWNKNKGYGTLFHRNSIRKFGRTKYHRTLFVAKYMSL